jgi:plastocyanin
MIDRRRLLGAGGLLLAGVCLNRPSIAGDDSGSARTVEITLRSDVDGAKVWFDPIGILINSGDTVRWVIRANVHTIAAYHPDNDNHSLRIPAAATPWDSGYLVNSGDSFEIKLIVPGVYDYFCAPHEHAGMVGRIVVDHPAEAGTNATGFFKSTSSNQNWLEVPEEARSVFPPVDQIITQRIVRVR